MNIDDILMHDETIFKNREAFNPNYVPDNFPHRESQITSLIFSLRPALRGGKPLNTLVLGSPATGKTTAIKKVFQKLEERSDKVACVYVNCQIHTTRFNIFSQIQKKILGYLPPETGIPFSRVYQNIMRHLADEKKALVVALDDVNYLFHSKNANKIFYDILRAHEEFEGVRTGLFAVISDIEFRYLLDKNVDSIFIPQEIVFDPYTQEEMRDILKERVKAGFYPDVISENFLDKIAEYAWSMGDLRAGINLLGLVGNIAEAGASKTITKEHLKIALKNTSSISLKNTIKTLSSDEKRLLQIIMVSGDDDLIAGNLYKLLNKAKTLSYASFDRILNKLEFLRIIDIKFTGKGMKGNSRVIILRFDTKEIEKCMDNI